MENQIPLQSKNNLTINNLEADTIGKFIKLIGVNILLLLCQFSLVGISVDSLSWWEYGKLIYIIDKWQV